MEWSKHCATACPECPLVQANEYNIAQQRAHVLRVFCGIWPLVQGGFGAVYRGVLDGVSVAVKVMDASPEAMQVSSVSRNKDKERVYSWLVWTVHSFGLLSGLNARMCGVFGTERCFAELCASRIS
jgi:hypothetical protein